MDNIKYVIIDDDNFAHDELIKLMEIHTQFECIGHYFNVMEAIKEINNKKPAFIFLDVEMPNLNGFELLNYIDPSIYVVMTSSHTNYAYDGFQHQVYDFLGKPVQQEKLFKTLFRLSEIFNGNLQCGINLNNFPEKDKSFIYASKLKEKASLKVNVKDIFYIEKLGNHLEIHCIKNGPYYRIENIKYIINELPSNYFKIINRSTIVNLSKTHWIDDKTLQFPDGKMFRVSESFK